jgi:two-component system chemotaxis response regulator CheB
MKYKAIVIGVSSGGLNVLKILLPELPADFCLPIIIVQHIGPHSENYWIDILNGLCKLTIKEADEKEIITKGNIYIAPANYHLLVEKDHTLSLSTEEKVNFARPSIDVLFESAAEAYKDKLIGIILTGSNNDGINGIKKIKEYGGLVIIQDPNTAESRYMPTSAITAISPDYILSIEKMLNLLIGLNNPSKNI